MYQGLTVKNQDATLFPLFHFLYSSLEADKECIKIQMKRSDRTCASCQIYLSSAYKFHDVFKGQPPETRCFYDRADGSVTTNKVFALGLHELSSYEVSTEKGRKLFKYFLPFADVKDDGRNAFRCSKCFGEGDEVRAKSVFLELSGKGFVISTDCEMVKTGNV